MTDKLSLSQLDVVSFVTRPHLAEGIQGGISGTVCEDTDHNMCPGVATKLPVTCQGTLELQCGSWVHTEPPGQVCSAWN